MRTRLALSLGGVSLVVGLLLLLVAPSWAQSPLRVSLKGTSQPNTSGQATLVAMGNQTQVTVEVSSLEANSEHVNHIHSGSCTAEGPIVYPLTNLKANQNGNAMAVTTIDKPIAEVANGQTYVNIHAGPSLPSPGITCGTIPTYSATPTGGPATGTLDPSGPIGAALVALGLVSLVGGLAMRRRPA